MTILALYSNKGGVGKTAAAVNLAYIAANSGHSTLICDIDPQSSTTFYFRVKPKLKRRARGFLKPSTHIDRSIKGTDFENLDLLPADFTHRNLAVKFDSLRRRKHRLEIILKKYRKEYEWIFLDCPPTINILAENIFNAADYILSPLIPTTLSLRTHEQLLAFLKSKKQANKNVYAFLSMVDNNKQTHRDMIPLMSNMLKRLLKNPIPYLPLIDQMGIYRKPVTAHAPGSQASIVYEKLWQEFTGKIGYRN